MSVLSPVAQYVRLVRFGCVVSRMVRTTSPVAALVNSIHPSHSPPARQYAGARLAGLIGARDRRFELDRLGHRSTLIYEQQAAYRRAGRAPFNAYMPSGRPPAPNRVDLCVYLGVRFD
jgi:hypothetical protein